MEVMTFVVIAAFFGLVFLVGAFSHKISGQEVTADSLLVGERKLSLWVGLCTMTATWVGGCYLCGTAEMVYGSGFVWAQAPWGYALSLIVGGLVFAGRMRRKGYTTFLDPFEERYGTKVTALLYIPALLGELFWSAAVLASLGFTLATLFGVDTHLSITISAILVILYTIFGGLMAVAYTDVLQLAMILAGLGVALPFALQTAGGWDVVVERFFEASPASSFGVMARHDFAMGSWVDTALLLVFGGIPWGVYFQRVLACPDERNARNVSIGSGFLCLLMAIPPAVVGMIGVSVDWNSLGLNAPEAAMILPAVLKYLTPEWVGVLGTAVVAAAVMSSVDASILSASSMFVWNVVRPFDTQKRFPVKGMLRLGIAVVGILAAWLALRTNSVYALWTLSSDLVYVILFPQLVVVLFAPHSTGRGALWGMAVAIILRVACGEPTLGVPSIFPAEWMVYPYKTIVMLTSLFTIMMMSEAVPSPSQVSDEDRAWQS